MGSRGCNDRVPKHTDYTHVLIGKYTSRLADVQALGEDPAAQQHKQEADEILRELTAAVPFEGPSRAKFLGLQAHIQQTR